MSTDGPVTIGGTLPPNNAPAPRPTGAVTVPQRNNSGSAVLLDDGRVLYMWCVGPGVGAHYQGYAPNLTNFLTLDNSVVPDPPLLTGMSGYDHSSVFFAPDGELYSIQASAGGWGGNPFRRKVEIWHSPDDGATWNVHGVMQDISTVGADGNNTEAVGEPFFVTSGPNAGRWVVSAPYYDNFSIGGSSVNRTRPAVWTSDDNGVTWTLRATEGRGPLGLSTDGESRNINRHDGDLWWAMHSQATAGGFSIYSSSDEGTTWSIVDASGTGFENVGWGFAWRDAADVLYCGYNGNKVVTFAPGLPDGSVRAFNQHTLLRTYSNIGTGGGLDQDVIFQWLGTDTLALMSDGRVIGFAAQQEEDCDCPFITVTVRHDGGFEPITFTITHPITLQVFVVVLNPGDPPVDVVLCGPFPDGDVTVPIDTNPPPP